MSLMTYVLLMVISLAQLCFPETTGSDVTSKDAKQLSVVGRVSAGTRMRFYYDGKFAGTHWSFHTASSYIMPSTTRVWAVKAWGLPGFTGFIASFSTGEVTGTDWKCTNKHYKGWKDPGFDDSSWPAARAIAKLHDRKWPGITDDINPDAYWIWTELKGGKLSDRKVYCRRTRDITVHMAADDMLKFYYDGIYVGQHFAYATSTNYTIPGSARVYAVYGRNYYKPYSGLVGSFSTGEVTGPGWKCTNTEEPGWTEVDFDDSAWPAAYVIEKIDGGTWPWYPHDISSRAYWIWTEDWDKYVKEAMDVYCRKDRRWY